MSFRLEEHHEILGALVIEWSNKSNVDYPRPEATGSKTRFQVFKEQVEKISAARFGGKITFDEMVKGNVKDIKIQELEDVPNDTMLIVVPQQKDAEKKASSKVKYPLPDFYAEDAFGILQKWPKKNHDPDTAFEHFRQMRIGDYCVNKCL